MENPTSWLAFFSSIELHHPTLPLTMSHQRVHHSISVTHLKRSVEKFCSQVIDYLEHIANQCQYSQFRHTYLSQFLAPSTLKVLHHLQSWNMDPHFNPRVTDASSWTIFSWISCLRNCEQHPVQIPTDRLTLTEIKYLLQFAYI